MELGSLGAALGLIGSVSVICLTVLRIWGPKKNNNDLGPLKEKVASLSEETAVNSSRIDSLEKDNEHLQNCFDKQNDLFLKLITEK